MITKQVVDTLYKKYGKRPKSPDCLDFGLLFDCIAEYHDVSVDMATDRLVINSIDEKSPFHKIPLSNIHAIVPFEEWVAVVMHSSIVFLNKKSVKVSVHIKPPKLTLWERIQAFFSK